VGGIDEWQHACYMFIILKNFMKEFFKVFQAAQAVPTIIASGVISSLPFSGTILQGLVPFSGCAAFF
jgi:hypothetical protein